MYFEINTAG